MNRLSTKRTGSLLIVDDNEMNRDMLARRLQRSGYHTVLAESGKRALALMEEERFDLALLDIAMPDMDGIQLLKILRQRFCTNQLRIIMVTASNKSATIVEALNLGANDYLTKPVDLPVALARIRTQLSHKWADEELEFQRTLLRCQTETSLDGILLVSSEGQWLSYNQRFLNMWDLRREDVENWTEEQTIQWMLGKLDDAPGFLATMVHLSEQVDESSSQELHLKDGRTFDCYSAPVKNLESLHYGRVWYYRDITERKWLEEAQEEGEAALRESEERYALAARGANDGLWDWNLRTNSIYFSPRWKSMLGCEESEIGDNPEEWLGRIHPNDIARVRQTISDHLEGRSPHFENEYRMLHQSGSYRWMLSRGLAVRDEDGNPTRMAGSQTDITDGKVVDALTGLPNRLLFLDHLERSHSRSRRQKNAILAVLVLDVDRFKVINDSLGHLVGDEFLIALSRRMESCLRTCNGTTRFDDKHLLARLGGDEFTILVEDVRHVSDVIRLAEKLTKEITAPFELGGQEIFPTVSIGISLSSSGYKDSADLLRDADTAMYRAKSKGKARVELFDSDMRERAVTQMQLETDLRKALERGEFQNVYQPIVCLASGQIVGFEALVRWRHPQRGVLGPAEFIPLAEETGMILSIGKTVTQEACQQMSSWQARFRECTPLMLSVNLSSKQFVQLDLANQVAEILRESGLDPESLKLEITESLVMENVEIALPTLLQLKALGVQLSIDDFGTGYSSLSYLHRFPIDTLKVDRSFVSRMEPNGENLKIVKSIINLAHDLNLDVIAEGVETADQKAQLLDLGCECAQGYYFSRPVEAAAIDSLISSSIALVRSG
ncbi:MAG: EAL domain-containing protein [Acidobacteriota bacterium]